MARGSIERVQANIDPKTFHERYVATRTPVIISGILQDPNFALSDLLGSGDVLDGMMNEIPEFASATVQVEQRS